MENLEYLSKFKACRDIGHPWYYEKWTGGKRTLVCDNCDTRRKDEIDSRGRITSRRYYYAKGYHLKRTPRLVQQLRLDLEREARRLTRWAGPRHLKLVKRRA
jgi:hypothetical protein